MNNKSELDKFVPSGGWNVDPAERCDTQFNLDETIQEFVAMDSPSDDLATPTILPRPPRPPRPQEVEVVVSTSDETEIAAVPLYEEAIFEFDPVRAGDMFLSMDVEAEERDTDQGSVENIFDVMDLVPVRNLIYFFIN